MGFLSDIWGAATDWLTGRERQKGQQSTSISWGLAPETQQQQWALPMAQNLLQQYLSTMGQQPQVSSMLPGVQNLFNTGMQQYTAPGESPVAKQLYQSYSDLMNKQFADVTQPSIQSTGGRYGLTGGSALAGAMAGAGRDLNLNLGKTWSDIMSTQQAMGQQTALGAAPLFASLVGAQQQFGAMNPLQMLLSLAGSGPGVVQTGGSVTGSQTRHAGGGFLGDMLGNLASFGLKKIPGFS